jgi:hypothetical protein
MKRDLKNVWQHMRDLGLAALAHANRHSAYWDPYNARWAELSVLQAAHAAELLIKARIAQEHPLLIFEQLPKPNAAGGKLGLEELLEQGRTIQWVDLPNRLWATTGTTLPGLARFREFGRLRNNLQHFGPAPDADMGGETLEFVFEVIDPFINDAWGLFAVDHDEDEPYVYFTATLARREIPFLVSPEAAKCFSEWEVDWDKCSDRYRKQLIARAKAAGAGDNVKQYFDVHFGRVPKRLTTV